MRVIIMSSIMLATSFILVRALSFSLFGSAPKYVEAVKLYDELMTLEPHLTSFLYSQTQPNSSPKLNGDLIQRFELILNKTKQLGNWTRETVEIEKPIPDPDALQLEKFLTFLYALSLLKISLLIPPLYPPFELLKNFNLQFNEISLKVQEIGSKNPIQKSLEIVSKQLEGDQQKVERNLRDRIEQLNRLNKNYVQPQLIQVESKIENQIHQLVDEMPGSKSPKFVEQEKKLQFKLRMRKQIQVLKAASMAMRILGSQATVQLAAAISDSGASSIMEETSEFFGNQPSHSLGQGILKDQGLHRSYEPFQDLHRVPESIKKNLQISVLDLSDQMKEKSMAFQQQLKDLLKALQETEASVPLFLTTMTKRVQEMTHLTYNASFDQKELLNSLSKIIALEDFIERSRIEFKSAVNSIASLSESQKSGQNRILNLDPLLYVNYRNAVKKQQVLTSVLTRAELEMAEMAESVRFYVFQRLLNVLKSSGFDQVHRERFIVDRYGMEVVWTPLEEMRDDVRQNFQKSLDQTSGSRIEPDPEVKRCFEIIDDNFVTFIHIFFNLKKFKSERQISNLFAKLTSTQVDGVTKVMGHIQVMDTELKDPMKKLVSTLQSNLLLKEYQNAMRVFKFLNFPLQLNEHLKSKSIGRVLEKKFEIPELAQIVGGEIQKFVQLMEWRKFEIFPADDDIFVGDFDHFYTWRHSQYQREIWGLMGGERVLMRSTLEDGLKNLLGVKLNKIEVMLKVTGSGFQRELEEKLKNFGITLKHLGNSYYRFGDEEGTGIVVMTQPLSLTHSFAKSHDGLKEKSKSFEKFELREQTLSPYGLWEIQIFQFAGEINGTSFEELSNFSKENEIELEMRAKVNYFKNLGDEYGRGQNIPHEGFLYNFHI